MCCKGKSVTKCVAAGAVKDSVRKNCSLLPKEGEADVSGSWPWQDHGSRLSLKEGLGTLTPSGTVVPHVLEATNGTCDFFFSVPHITTKYTTCRDPERGSGQVKKWEDILYLGPIVSVLYKQRQCPSWRVCTEGKWPFVNTSAAKPELSSVVTWRQMTQLFAQPCHFRGGGGKVYRELKAHLI